MEIIQKTVRSATVSILIPVFNAGPWIKQCLDSAFAQKFPVHEVIVFDDGSTDDTLQILRLYGDRLRLVAGTHVGGNAARNRLLELATGDWLQFLDADDYLLPDKIAEQMARAAQSPELNLIYSPIIVRDENNGSDRAMQMSESADLPLHFIRWNSLNTNGFLWKRSFMLLVGGWKTDQPACQEHELLFRMIEAGAQFSLVNQPGAVYRIHAKPSVSRMNPLRTVQLQMDLIDKIQEYLVRDRPLTATYRKALYIARMKAARVAWKSDPAMAERLVAKARSTGVWWAFCSSALPPSYQILARLLGFGTAERLAALKRSILV